MCRVLGEMLCLIIIVCLQAFLVSAQDELPAMNRLRDELLVKRQYDKFARPVKNRSTRTYINTTISILKIAELDTMKGVLTCEAYTFMEWTDEHLTWNSNDFGGLSEAFLKHDEVWIPTVFVYPRATNRKFLSSWSENLVRVNNSGRVFWTTGTLFQTKCRISLKDYPFDKQLCFIFLSSENLYGSNLVGFNSNSDLSKLVYGPFIDNPEWETLNVSVKLYNGGSGNLTYTYLQIKLTLERRSNGYTYFIFLPYFSASVLAVVMFLLPLGSGQRSLLGLLSIGMLVLLLVFLGFELGFQSISRDSPYAVVCIGTNLFLVGLAVLMPTLLFHTMSHFDFACPQILGLFARNAVVAKVLCLHLLTGISEENLSSELNPKEDAKEGLKLSSLSSVSEDWIHVAAVLDRMFFCAYVCMFMFLHG